MLFLLRCCFYFALYFPYFSSVSSELPPQTGAFDHSLMLAFLVVKTPTFPAVSLHSGELVFMLQFSFLRTGRCLTVAQGHDLVLLLLRSFFCCCCFCSFAADCCCLIVASILVPLRVSFHEWKAEEVKMRVKDCIFG